MDVEPSITWDEANDRLLLLQRKAGMDDEQIARYYNVSISDVQERFAGLQFIEQL